MNKSMQRVLLVGGPLDGQWKEVDVNNCFAEFSHSELPPPAELLLPIVPPPAELPLPIVTMRERLVYERTTWSIGDDHTSTGAVRHVYVIGGGRAQLFDKLLQGYKPECVWTRLPDIKHPAAVNPFQFRAGCNGAIARGASVAYPDFCPACHRPVRVAT